MLIKRFTFALLLVVTLSAAAIVQQASVGVFEHHQDVGAVATPGSVVYNAEKTIYTIKALGTNMWATKDEFHYAWKRMNGNFILRARAEFIGKGGDRHRQI